MDANIQKKIIKEIKNLDSFQLSEVLDFVDFLYQKRKIKTPTPTPDAIDSMWGKYRKSLSGSGEFARRKLDEIKKEEEKWHAK